MTNILVIDEDKICRNNVKYQLCDKGYYVTSLEYLDEARDSEHKYDLVLMENCESLNQYYIEELKNILTVLLLLCRKHCVQMIL